MSETNYFRLIEAYFDGSIKPEQKAMLESKIQTDPLLKAEFDLQQNIIQGIGTLRTQQLKARLSAIDVSGTGSLLVGSSVKWLAATVASVTVFSSLLYFYLGSSLPIEQVDLKLSDAISWDQRQVEPEVPTVIENTASDSKTVKEKDEQLAADRTKTDPNIELLKEIEATAASKANESATVKPQSLLTFEDETHFTASENKTFTKTAEERFNNSAVNNIQIEFNNSAEFTDAYQYKYFNNKLFLFGDFEEEPYQIIELRNKGKKQLFLSYQGIIYSIEDNTTSRTILPQVEDEMLILELELIMKEEK